MTQIVEFTFLLLVAVVNAKIMFTLSDKPVLLYHEVLQLLFSFLCSD